MWVLLLPVVWWEREQETMAGGKAGKDKGDPKAKVVLPRELGCRVLWVTPWPLPLYTT